MSIFSMSMISFSLVGVIASNDTIHHINEDELQEKYDEVYQQDAELIDYLNNNMDELLADGKEKAKLDTEK